MQKFEIGKEIATKPFDRHWQFCTGSGHAKMAMRADYGKQLRMVQEDLGIRRVRFHGIFCDDMDTYHTFSDIFPIPVSMPEEQEITEMSFRSIAVAYDKFLEQIAPQMDEVMDFCLSRTDGDGFMRGKQGEWIFIDWAPMDKTGAVCGEQILYAAALQRYADICGLLGRSDDRGCRERADKLQKQIFAKFYDPEKKVFIDSFESGKRNVTRQSNILAYLFLPCTDGMKKDIYEKVVLNDAVTQITTPYFKFYENQVHCKAGDARMLEESMRKYYGSMLATGATTLYEEYDPAVKGAEHYAMYGHPYQKSLCHAWSASPIYLFGAFRMGVQNTGIAYSTFDVRPLLGDMESFEGTVPVPGSAVRVSVNGQEIRVRSDIPGGTLYAGEECLPLKAGVETVVHMPC